MSVSKKHFVAIAAIIDNARDTNSRKEACDCVALDMADYLATLNPNFNKQRFLDACGVVDE